MSEPAIPTARAVLHSSGELRRYRPAGGARPGALLAVLIGGAVAGIVAGVIIGFVSRWFSLFIMFPLLIGATAGWGAAFVVGKVRMRAPMLAFGLAMLGGGLGYVASHVMTYVHFRAVVAAGFGEEQPAATDEQLDTVIDAGILEVSGHAGFRGYLDIAAKAGISIKRAGASDKGADFTGTAAWVIWGIELALVTILAGWIARMRAREPFCTACSTWFGPPRVVRGGPATNPDVREFERLLVGHLPEQAAGVFVGSGSMAKAHLELVIRQCTRCAQDVHCTLRSVSVNPKQPEHKNYEEFLLAMDEAMRLLSSINARRSVARPTMTPWLGANESRS